MLDSDSLESAKQISNFFKLTKGRNRNDNDFAAAKNDIFESVDVKANKPKTEVILIVFLAKINTDP